MKHHDTLTVRGEEMKTNPLLKLSNKNPIGVYSVCTASEPAIEAALEFARDNDSITVIESTANQVNQFGGYTGMKPADYVEFVHGIADRVGLAYDRIILGGDHLGPLTWTDKNEDEAMEYATQLVYDYVYAGFTKIHLDTSMMVADDNRDERLSDETIARRSAVLAQSCLKAYNDLKAVNPDAVFPAFIIGSEVPIPGGLQEVEETIEVTSPEDFMATYETFKKAFDAHDVNEVFESVIAIVVQPGVEFGDDDLFIYDREKAKALTTALKENYDTLAFEGHSSDYQTPEALKEMVEDGVVILKVGPALTFAYREALFALSHIEDIVSEDPSNFIEVLEQVMLDKPGNWEKHYHGTERELFIKRKFSYSDRARYYLPQPEVQAAIEKLMDNLSKDEIPMTLLSQYLPYQWRNIKDGKIENNPKAIVLDYIKLYYEDYHYATQVDKLI